jgi:antitoxin (DNA-binding transcriptional repressor) of toxin-antitoxin stability system
MLVVSTREFRQNQKNYLDRIDAGAQVFIQRGKDRRYAVSAVKKDDALMTEEEFFAKIDRAKEQVRQGKCTTVRSKEELLEYLDGL